MNRSLVVKVLKFLMEHLPSESESISRLINSLDQITFETKAKKIPEIMPVPDEIKNESEGIILFADGACRGNPGPGSWATIAHNFLGETLYKASGLDLLTTNNKMELMGAIEALKWSCQEHKDVPLYFFSDSKYVIEGVTKWVPGWKARNWKKADNKEPENLSLWKELDLLIESSGKVKLFWVKGHAGVVQNEICDQLANEALNEAGY